MPAETTPSFDLEGKTVLITGTSRGIGRACALACAGSGADLIVAGIDLSKLEEPATHGFVENIKSTLG